MPVNHKRFKTPQGFESPGFVVDNTGDLAAQTITAVSQITSPVINTNNVNIGGVPIFASNGTVLSATVVGSSLQEVGTLTSLTTDGNVRLRYQGENKISLVDGKVTIRSETPGNIDNIDIGITTPGIVRSRQINVVDFNGAPGQLNASSSSINFNNSTIAGAVVFSTAPVAATPVTGDQLARKDYVDNSSIAFAVAFGA